ncbi:MAG: zinc-ribbon domain-containing protein [Candidatus Lokiarchaeota archaeon]|nr:zinc-ribbon domain-containing protein [Candidatus Lokiarchaeota archaeon]
MNCPNCGAEVRPNQNFCESCGSKLPENIEEKQEKSKAASALQPAPSTGNGGLFDLNRNYYILKEGYWDWGSGDILDKDGNVIGKMKRKILSIRRKVELRELDGTVAATIHAKLISARGAQDLKDPEGNLIARIKKKILTLFKPKFYLEDPEGNRWYEAVGNFMGFSFKVKDLSSGEIIAEIEKADRWRDIFLGGMFDFKDTYALRIHDNTTDRRILVGFVLSIDNVMHDQ